MGLFGRKSSFEKYKDEAEQDRLASVRRDEERKHYIEDHVEPWIEKLAAPRDGANRCSPEAYKAAGDPGWPVNSSDIRWFADGAEGLVRRKEMRAKVQAASETDEAKARLLHDEVEFWMSVGTQLSNEGILRHP